MPKINVFVMIIGQEYGSNKMPYTTNIKHPAELIIRNLITDFIKNETSTVAIAA
jgi:hypothetical protein